MMRKSEINLSYLVVNVMTRGKQINKMISFARFLTKWASRSSTPFALFCILWLLSPGPPATRHCARVSLRALAAMIGKMADDQEFEEKTGSSDSEEEEDDEEDNVTNGRDDVDEDESEYDDPEGFVDDITDEGNFIVQLTG